MEWSWRTVLILLGLLLVVGVMVDGFRRMRRARAEALRLDLDKESLANDLFNDELPQPYRVVSHGADADSQEPYFSDTPHFDSPEAPEPSFADNPEPMAESDPAQSFESTEAESEPLPEPLYESEPDLKSETELESDTETELEADTAAAQEPEPLVARPINLDEATPVLVEVEELGEENMSMPEKQGTKDEPDLDFQEVDADPFAELEMNETDAALEEKASIMRSSSESEEAVLYTEEALSVDASAEPLSGAPEAEENQTSDNPADAPTQTDAHPQEQEQTKLAPLLYASSDAEKLSERAPAQMDLVIHCISRDDLGFSGDALVGLFNQCDVRFGENEIFHRFEKADGKGQIQFSIIHSFEPRHFSPATILDKHFRGLSLYMKLPGAKDPASAYEAMVAIAQLLANHFNADLFDGQRSALTQQTIEHERQQIVDFEYRQKVAAKKQAQS